MDVKLTALFQDDLPTMVEWQEREDLAEFFRNHPPAFVWTDPRVISSYLEGYQAIRLDGKLVGVVVLQRVDRVNLNAQFGMLVVPSSEYRRSEVAEKAFHEVARYVFDYLHLHKLYCASLEHRVELHKHLGRVGFKFEAILKDACFWKDRFFNEVVFSLLAKDYKRRL